jgi:hypothetical protein
MGIMAGAMLARDLRGPAVQAAATTAATTVARTFGQKLLGTLRGILSFGFRGLLLPAIAFGALEQIVVHWQGISRDLTKIWEDLRKAAPMWLWGEGQGLRALTHGPGQEQLGRDLERYITPVAQPIEDYVMGTSWGRWLHEHGILATRQENRQRWRISELDADARATLAMGFGGATGNTVTVTGNPINVTINVTNSNADPNTIGEAAGNAVGSGLRGALGDTAWPLP